MAQARYTLTPEVLAANAAGEILCLDRRAEGRTFTLHDERPDASLNYRLDIVSPDGVITNEGATEAATGAVVTRVDISGPIEQRAGYHGECGGWSDGHDAIAERMCAALTDGDVFLVIDSPGGAAAGMQAAIDRVLACKTESGRAITAFANEQIGSAGYAWACVADAIYLPAAGQVGSIGARGKHESIAGMLEKAGVAVTYFADPPEKVALAPELPLSEIGAMRGNRDVSIVADAFRALVTARRGIDRETLIALGADCLTGQAAVDAGLADGVCSLDEAAAYAMTMAETPPAEDTTATAKAAQPGSRTMATRTDGIRSEDDGDEDAAKPAGTEPDGACKGCGMANEKDAKFCDQCGASMAAAPIEDAAPPPSPDDDDAPPPPPPKPGTMAPPVAAGAKTIAARLGLRSDASRVAIDTAAVPHLNASAYLMQVTGAANPREAMGSLQAMANEARSAVKLRASLAEITRANEAKERRELCFALTKADPAQFPPGQLFLAVDTDGNALPAGTKRLAPHFEAMNIDHLRGLAKGVKATAPTARRDPFRPDPGASKVTPNADGSPSAAAVEAAKRHPAVINAAARAGALPIDQLARAHAAQFGGVQ